MSEMTAPIATDDASSQTAQHGASNARASITESGLRYFFAFALATLFLMVGLAFVCGIAWTRADVAYAMGQDARMEARVAQDENTRLRIELAHAEGRADTQPKGR